MSIVEPKMLGSTVVAEAKQSKPSSDVHNSLVDLIAGHGSLQDTLQAITNQIAHCDGVMGCFLAWKSQIGEKTCHFVSSGLPIDIGKELDSLNADELDALTKGAHSILDGQSQFEYSTHPIFGADGETLAIAVLTRTPMGNHAPNMQNALLDNCKTMIVTSILCEARAKDFGDANDRFASLVNYVPGVVYQRVVRPDGSIRYTYISEAAEDLFGVSPQEILADPQALFDCQSPEYYATFRDRLIEASKALSLWDVEATIFTRSGKKKYTHAIARPHRQVDGSVVWNGVILDQTRIKEAELAAAEAEACTRDTIIESIPQAFALFDKNDNLVTWNSRYSTLYRELKDTLQHGTSYSDIVKAEIETGIDKVPESIDPKGHFYQRLAHHHQLTYEAERQSSDGHWILINEHRTAEGGTVVLHTDVTELKKREFALQQSNKELEAFASIASHDLQEPLRKIDAFGSRLQSRFADKLGKDGNLYIERMQSSVGRMRDLINDLLDYSRVTTQGKDHVEIRIEDVVEEVLGDLQILIESTNGKVCYTNLPVIPADRTQLRQLLQNLVANALKFHKPDIPPEVEIRFERALHINDAHKLMVQDNGIGFDMKYAERIFGIFQRLHGRSDYDGTGVGLATCRKIAERHGWSIRANSELGKGTTFTVYIPTLHSNVIGNEK